MDLNIIQLLMLCLCTIDPLPRPPHCATPFSLDAAMVVAVFHTNIVPQLMLKSSATRE